MIGECNFVNSSIVELYITEWNPEIIPVHTSNNLISSLHWVTTGWFQLKLITATATYSQEMSTVNPDNIFYNDVIELTLPKASNDKWKDLTDILRNKYIVVLRDANNQYIICGSRTGLHVRNYQLSNNQYILTLVGFHGNNLPTFIEESYILSDIINNPTPSPTPSISRTPTQSQSITPSASISRSVSPTVTPSPSISASITPSISVTPSITPSITPSTSSTIGTLALENNASIPSINDVRIQDLTITTASFPLVYPDTTTGYTSDTGSQNVDVYITDWEGGSNYITLIDSNSVTYYKTVEGNSGHTFASVYISVGIPVRISLEDGSAPSPSVTPSISTSITPTPSTSTGSSPTPSPTLTPSVTPSPFGPTINISNDGTYNITNIQISGVTVSNIEFPIGPSNSVVGYTTIYNNNVSIDVTLSQGSTGESITVNLNCTTTDGGNSYNFSGVNTTTGTVTISYSTGICS